MASRAGGRTTVKAIASTSKTPTNASSELPRASLSAVAGNPRLASFLTPRCELGGDNITHEALNLAVQVKQRRRILVLVTPIGITELGEFRTKVHLGRQRLSIHRFPVKGSRKDRRS